VLYEVSVSRAFTASHSMLLPSGSPEPAHEHDWRMTATFRADRLDGATAVAIDFTAVQRAMDSLVDELQGTVLNSLAPFGDGRCTAERVAEYLAGRLAERLDDRRPYRLTVTEAPGCSAAFYPDGP